MEANCVLCVLGTESVSRTVIFSFHKVSDG